MVKCLPYKNCHIKRKHENCFDIAAVTVKKVICFNETCHKYLIAINRFGYSDFCKLKINELTD